MFGGHGGVQMTTNLATFVYVSKSETLQKHPLSEQANYLSESVI